MSIVGFSKTVSLIRPEVPDLAAVLEDNRENVIRQRAAADST
jgi:hypothetical protein